MIWATSGVVKGKTLGPMLVGAFPSNGYDKIIEVYHKLNFDRGFNGMDWQIIIIVVKLE